MEERQILKYSEAYAKKKGWKINPDKKQLGYVLKGLKSNEDKKGERYCTCRVQTGNFEEDRIIICPCIYAEQEIKDWGHCLCRLFFAKDYSAQNSKNNSSYCDKEEKQELKSWVDEKLVEKARKDKASFVIDRMNSQEPQCMFGYTGVCCKNCNMGPCRITPKASRGVCGAAADTIASRNLLRSVSSGACCHVEHARENALLLWKIGIGKNKAYHIHDEAKLKDLAKKLGKKGSTNKMAELVALEAFEDFRRQQGVFHKSEGDYLNWLRISAPKYLQDEWKRLDILPENADIETTRVMHATTMGNDADPNSLIQQCLKLGLVDSYIGLRMATDIQDIIFGTPYLMKAEANLGTIKEDYINLSVHGHIPILAEKVKEWAKKLEPEAIKAGSKGINLVGICCIGNEMAQRHGVHMAAHTMQAELALVTGAMEAMVVDAQCIYPSLASVASCYHTKFITTMVAKMPGAIHIPFKVEEADETAKKIVRIAIENYKNRNKAKIYIPKQKTDMYSGFSVEQIIDVLKKVNQKEPLKPLLDNIKAGNIRGIAAIVGCRNAKLKGKKYTETLIKQLLNNNILVVTTGCISHASAQEGLLHPNAVKYCGDKLKSVLVAIGKANGLPSLPPVLHMGSCVDNSRIIRLVNEISNYSKIPINKLPVVASAPELVTEKAMAIGTGALTHGLTVHVNPPLWTSGAKLLESKLQNLPTGGKLFYEEDFFKAAKKITGAIDEKRKILKI